jgi:hypothetical protein
VSRLPRQRAPPRSLRGKQKCVPLCCSRVTHHQRMPACILALERTYCQVLQRRGLIQKSVLIVVRVIATRVCVAGLGLRYSTIATSAQRRRSGANRVPISSSFTSAAPAFDSDVAGKAVPLGPYSRLLSGRLPQLGPYVTFERGARPISGHETKGRGTALQCICAARQLGLPSSGPERERCPVRAGETRSMPQYGR